MNRFPHHNLILFIVISAYCFTPAYGQNVATPTTQNAASSTTIMTADTLLDALLEEMRDVIIDPSEIAETMRRAQLDHVHSAQSRQQLQTWPQQQLDRRFEQGIADIQQSLNRDGQAITLDWLRQRTNAILAKKRAELDLLARREFDAAYTKARQLVSERQWTDLQPRLSNFHPQAVEIERATAGEHAEAAVQTQLNEYLRQAGVTLPLFDELETRITAAVQQAISTGVQELRTQRTILKDTSVTGATPQTIETSFRAALKQHIAEIKTSYGIFPSIETALPTTATQLAETRLRNTPQPAALCSTFTDERLESIITNNIAAHQQRTASISSLETTLAPESASTLLTTYLAAQHDATEHTDTLQTMLVGPLAMPFTNALHTCLAERAPKVRQAIVTQQLRQFFPTLDVSGISEDNIMRYRDRLMQAPTEDLLNWVGINSRNSTLLEETRQGVETTVRELFTQGNQALDQQLALAENERGNIERNRQAGNTREAIVSQARANVETQWRSAHSNKYPRLFRATERHIDDLVINALK
jgi:hypothetical protein